MAVKQLSWRRSNRALFFFSLLLVPTYSYSMDGMGDSVSSSIAQGSCAGASASLDPASVGPDPQRSAARLAAQAAQYTQRRKFDTPVQALSDQMVEACKRNMPPLLQGFYAYQKSPDSTNLKKQILPFHKLLLVGPPGTGKSETMQAIGQDLKFEVKIVKASSFRGSHRGQTAMNIESFFESLRHETKRIMLVINELHKLFEGYENHHNDHSENAHTFWEYLDDFEKNKPNIIIAGTANHADKLPPELKSRFRVQYVYMPCQDKSEWLLGIQADFDEDSDVEFEDEVDLAALTGSVTSEGKDKSKDESRASSAGSDGKKEDDDSSQSDPFDSIKNDNTIDLKKEFHALAKDGLSFRDRHLYRAAAKIFAYRIEKRTASGKLVVSKDHILQAFMQLFDKDKILDFDVKQESEEARQERHHRETLAQQDFHFVQQQIIQMEFQNGQKTWSSTKPHIVGTGSATNTEVRLRQEAIDAAHSYISDEQKQLFVDRMEKTRKRKNQEQEGQKSLPKNSDGGCIIQ